MSRKKCIKLIITLDKYSLVSGNFSSFSKINNRRWPPPAVHTLCNNVGSIIFVEYVKSDGMSSTKFEHCNNHCNEVS